MGLMGRMGPICFISENDCPHWHLYHLGHRATAVHLLPLPMPAVLGLDDGLVKKIRKIVDVNVRAKNHVAAAAAIAAIRPAFRHEFFPAKTDAAASAVAGLAKNFDSI